MKLKGRGLLSLSLSLVRKPVVYVILVLLIFGAFFSTFGFVPPAKKAKAAGNTYYVDATDGLDGNTGLSEGQAWKTIAKVNGIAFNAGDTILFKRGETWSTTALAASHAGSNESPITFGSYGSGAFPKIQVSTYSIVITANYVSIVGMDVRGIQISGARTGIVVFRCLSERRGRWHRGASGSFRQHLEL